MLTDEEGEARFGKLMWWWGTEAAEGDHDRRRRELGQSRQYMARKAHYSYAWKVNGFMPNVVEIDLRNARNGTVAKTTVMKKVWDARPTKTPQLEVEWACKQCGVSL